ISTEGESNTAAWPMRWSRWSPEPDSFALVRSSANVRRSASPKTPQARWNSLRSDDDVTVMALIDRLQEPRGSRTCLLVAVMFRKEEGTRDCRARDANNRGLLLKPLLHEAGGQKDGVDNELPPIFTKAPGKRTM